MVTRHFGFLGFTSFIAVMLGFKSLILNSNSFCLFLSWSAFVYKHLIPLISFSSGYGILLDALTVLGAWVINGVF